MSVHRYRVTDKRTGQVHMLTAEQLAGRPRTGAAVARWISRLEEQNPQYRYGYDANPIYFKVWRELHGIRDSRSVVSFVSAADGTVFRADGWKKRGRRLGNVFEYIRR